MVIVVWAITEGKKKKKKLKPGKPIGTSVSISYSGNP